MVAEMLHYVRLGTDWRTGLAVTSLPGLSEMENGHPGWFLRARRQQSKKTLGVVPISDNRPSLIAWPFNGP